MIHTPVMLQEVLDLLNLHPGMRVLDATIGAGGHAKRILERIQPQGFLIGMDQDKEILEVARDSLGTSDRVRLFCENFRNAGRLLQRERIQPLDACLLDLGVSSYQLEKRERGFSFQTDGKLDMRMDTASSLTAFELVNRLPEREMADLLHRLGQERYARRIASSIVRARHRQPIQTTGQLAELIGRAVPYRGGSRVHPATRTFQAFRMAVNQELEALEEALPQMAALLKTGGRICVISFHSLEDRAVKFFFRRLVTEKQMNWITKKPLTPSPAERLKNPRSRSAKLRVAEKC